MIYNSGLADSSRWAQVRLRPGDIVISTPSKCGTTWMQMICALLIFQSADLPAPLTTLSPWLDMTLRPLPEVLHLLEAQQHRRFIKTHTPLDGLPQVEGVHYIVVGRDPRDAAVSMDHHRANLNPEILGPPRPAVPSDHPPNSSSPPGVDRDREGRPPRPVDHSGHPADPSTTSSPLNSSRPPGAAPDSQGQQAADVTGAFGSESAGLRDRVLRWIRDERPPAVTLNSLRAVLWHLHGAWLRRHEPAVTLVHFDELRRDLGGQMRHLADRLGIAVDDWAPLVEAAGFERMRARAAVLAPDEQLGLFASKQGFFRDGGSQQWRTVLTEVDLEEYRQILATWEPGFGQWLHQAKFAG